jgi:hypothetical protein
MGSQDDVIETTAGEASAELARRGVGPDVRVAITLREGSRLDETRPKLSVIAQRMRATAAKRGHTTEVFDKILADS